MSLDPEQLLELTGRVLDEFVERVGAAGREVVAVGVSCFFHSLVGLGRDGRALTPLLSWADTSAAPDAAELARRTDVGELLQATGAPPHAGYWPAKIARLRRLVPGIRRWAGFSELLFERLVGDGAIGVTMASGTGLFDRRAEGWSRDLLALLDLDEASLPRIVDDDRPFGQAPAPTRRRWPALARAVWFVPWGDGACGNVGLGCTTPERSALMIGTSGASRVILPEPAAPIPAGLFGYRLGRSRTLLGGQLSEGGGTLAWLAGVVRRSLASLEREARMLEPGAGELTILPFLAGERGTGYHEDARGVVVGLQLDTGPAELFRGFIEAIALRFAEVDERMTRALPARPTITAGGGALDRSALWSQVIADVLGREIEVALVREASSRGAALLALAGCGVLPGADAVAAPPTRLVEPDLGRHARYREARARQAELYRSTFG